jgi:hypothetical protein
MPTTRKTIHRRPTRRITKRAVDIFDNMEALKKHCSCGADIIRDECDTCKEWWRQHNELHDELKLRPWQWPAYGDYEDNNKTGVLERYLALKAASDARKSKDIIER